ncbi:hypothetical protein TSOC_008266 [Tetrabaena socialis]|uniref:Nudix hydrolase domain-containing protein n=1 Tax=Tetrabaena socialis TaxID=47790 RepID=A0A2J7ZYV5_9CHLO|nr:hypothetical protein TSOC_008266 [Tetrabaena socialis]|eukprot:PNH05447.1 hypothetical protein TSOC_008266 [Tetrabaena socialis]
MGLASSTSVSSQPPTHVSECDVRPSLVALDATSSSLSTSVVCDESPRVEVPSLPPGPAVPDTPARPWGVSDAPLDSQGSMFGWRIDFNAAPSSRLYAAAGVMPFAYKEDEGELYALLSVQRDKRASRAKGGSKDDLVYTFLGGKVEKADGFDAAITAAREALEESHRLLSLEAVLRALRGVEDVRRVRRGARSEPSNAGDGGAGNGGGGGDCASSSGNGVGNGVCSRSAFPAGSKARGRMEEAAAGASGDGGGSGPGAASAFGSGSGVDGTSSSQNGAGNGVSAHDDGGSPGPGAASRLGGSDRVGPGGGSRAGGGGGGADESSISGRHRTPHEYFSAGRYMLFGLYLPDAWQLPAECAARVEGG